MKLITLNLWGGKVYHPLLQFIESYASDIDIFCFQEVLFGSEPRFTPINKARENIFQEILQLLKDFEPVKYISPSEHFAHESITFGVGQSIFLKRPMEIKDNGGFHCYDKMPENTEGGGKATGNLQWVDVSNGAEVFTIANLHGIWIKDTKKADCPARITQSKKIKNFLDSKNNKKILCGDFNLIPNGESMRILNQGMVNLVKEYNIQSTRSSYYKKDIKFADYVLVSPNIEVSDFAVLQDEVSDHLPLFLQFS